MENTAQTAAPTGAIDDIYTLVLFDGLKVKRDGKDIHYKVVKLRETGVADERAAQRVSERVVLIDGVHKLLQSDADFRFAMTMRHIESLNCDTLSIPLAALDLDLLGRLSSHDFGLIEARVFLVELAAEVRYGNITQAAFDAMLQGKSPQAEKAASPQPAGQAAELGQAAAAPGPGPALLADFVGNAAGGKA